MKKIAIAIEDLSLEAEILETPTGERILESLPLEGAVNVWGEELYFVVPVRLDLEPDAREEVEVGDLAYWPSGPAFCIFFGPTPVSTGDRPRAYSPVNVFGKIVGDTAPLKKVSQGARIELSLRRSRNSPR
jgi:hypothetical protein